MASTTVNTTVTGFVYCMSSKALNGSSYNVTDPFGIYVVGHCLEDPMEKIKKMEGMSDIKYTLEFAKKVKNPKRKDENVQTTLDEFDARVIDLDEFDFEIDQELDLYKCPKAQIKQIFNYFVGDWYVQQ